METYGGKDTDAAQKCCLIVCLFEDQVSDFNQVESHKLTIYS